MHIFKILYACVYIYTQYTRYINTNLILDAIDPFDSISNLFRTTIILGNNFFKEITVIIKGCINLFKSYSKRSNLIRFHLSILFQTDVLFNIFIKES